MLPPRKLTIRFEDIATQAGFPPKEAGKLDLPVCQKTADLLAAAAARLLGDFEPGDPPTDVVVTGAGPVWGYLAVAHSLHGRCRRLDYVAPNATICVWSHGASE